MFKRQNSQGLAVGTKAAFNSSERILVMSNQNVQTKEQQDKESQGSAMTQSSQKGEAAARRSNDPFGLMFAPDLFLMNPFSMLRTMTAGALAGSAEGGDLGVWFPAIEVSQKDGQFVVHAELPGLKPEDGKVAVAGYGFVVE